jgi:hypothetical protein
MNTWAKHYGGEFDRRVYRREFETVLGYGTTWFRTLEKRGVIPAGRTDPGGKRKWWFASEVQATSEKLTGSAVREAA